MIHKSNDPLILYLAELVQELDGKDIYFILGGGMCLYIRQTMLSDPTSRYPFEIPVRSTADLDVFLSSEIIVDATKIEILKQSLLKLGYAVSPLARNFQFVKTITLYGMSHTIKIDLLAALPPDEELGKVEIKNFRIRPIGAKGIHAYRTDAATGLDIAKQSVDLSNFVEHLQIKSNVLFIPSTYNYLILKLHAFNDRKDDRDEDYGRHHAFDIFATVARMNEEDWKIARQHLELEGNRQYLNDAIEIRKQCFSATSDSGLLRLRENKEYASSRDVFDKYIQEFIKDLRDLFPE